MPFSQADFGAIRRAAALLEVAQGVAAQQAVVLSGLAFAAADARAVAAAPSHELEAIAAAVVAALRRHAHGHALVARHGAAALARLARHSAACGAAARDAGALHALVAAMRAHPRDAPAVGEACAALQALGSGDAAAQRAAGAAGGIEAILDVLRAHAAHEGVSLAACDALSALLSDCAANATRACAAGALAPLTAALRTHGPRDRDVALRSCRALTLLIVRNADEADRLATLPPAHVLAAIRAVVAVMDARPADAQLLNEGACALNWLVDTSERRRFAGAAGAVRALVRALRCAAAWSDGDAERGDALTHVCNALARVCESDAADNQAAAVSAGAPRVLIDALRAHPAHGPLQRAAVFALSSLALAPRAQPPTAAAAALDAVVGAMRANNAAAAAAPERYNKDIHIYGCAAIAATIVRHQDGGVVEDHAIACGAIEAAVAAIKMHHSPAHRVCHYVFTCAVSALDVLTHTGSAAHEAHAVRAGALEAILADGRPVGAQMEEVFMSRLRAAAQRHDEAVPPCAHAGCERCAAAARARGDVCALAGCGAKARGDDAGDGQKKPLLALHRCGRCRVAAYCGEAHQAAGWRRHKRECAALAAVCERAAADAEE
jgi:hypothetical protein